MSKLARALLFGAMVAALNLASMTAIAQAHTSDEDTINRHRALGQLEFLAAADHAVDSREQAAADTAHRRELARDRSSIPSGTPTQVPTPVQPAEPSGHSNSLLAWLGALTTLLALVGGLAVLAARRASRRVRAGQTAA
jgi:hypothetical protein